jgi:WD40 repeat protein
MFDRYSPTRLLPLILTLLAIGTSQTARAQSDMMWAARGMAGMSELAISTDGGTLMTSDGYTVRGWTTADGSLDRSPSAFSVSYGYNGTFSEGSRYFANADQAALLRVYDGRSLAPLDSAKLPTDLGPLLRLLFSPDGSRLLAIGGQRVALYSAPDLKLLWSVTSSPASAAAFSRDGTLIVWNEREQLALFRAATGGLVRRLEGTHAIVDAGFANGDGIVAGYNGREIVTWNVWDGSLRQVMFDREIADGHRMVLDQGGLQAITYSTMAEGDSTMRIWRIADGARLHDFGLPGVGFPLGKAVVDRGRLVVMTSTGSAVWIDTTDGAVLRSIGTGLGKAHGVISFLDADNEVVVAAGDGTMRFYDGGTGALRHSYATEGIALRFSRDGSSWIELDRKSRRTLRLRETATGALLRVLPFALDEAQLIAISDDLERVAWGPTAGRAIYVHDASSGRRLYSLQSAGPGTVDLAFSPNGAVLAEVGGYYLALWNMNDGTLRAMTYESGLTHFTPSGREIVRAFSGYMSVSSIDAVGTESRRFATSSSHFAQVIALTSNEQWLIHAGDSLRAIAFYRGVVDHTYFDPVFAQFAYGYSRVVIDRRNESFISINTTGDIVRWRMSGVLAAPDDGRTTGADVTVIPSTARDRVRIAFDVQSSGKQTLELVAATGERVLSRSLAHDMGPAVEIVDVGELPSGLYLVSLRMGERRLTGRVVVSH